MTSNKYFSFIEEFKNNFDDKMPSLEILKEKIYEGSEILDWSEIRPDVDQYVLGIKKRLCNNLYSSSIRAYLCQEDEIVLVGKDDRSRQESNYALIRGKDIKDIYCWAGNARNDGHLNEFINNTDGYIPNSVYHIENVSYKTDSIGRVCRTYERHTTKRATDRNEARGDLSKIAKSKGGMNGAVGGHIVAHSIDGPMEAINILPMDNTFNNKGDWKEMENLFKKEYQADRDFDVRRIISYQDQTQIPSKIDVDAIIQGEYKSWSFELPKNT